MHFRAIAEHGQGSSPKFSHWRRSSVTSRIVSTHALLHAVLFSRGLEGLSNEDMIAEPDDSSRVNVAQIDDP
jgi:hypothetical protein